jgi:hypothetical protein
VKIWEIGCEVDYYSSFNLQKESDIEIVNSNFDKGQIIEGWMPLELKSMDNHREIGDNPKFWPYSNLLMVSEKAKSIISKKYSSDIQFLEVVDTTRNEKYYLINILNIIDGIDDERSEFKILAGKYVVGVTKYVLNDNVKRIPIFKLYLNGMVMPSYTFIGDEFKKLLEDNALNGFKFTEVYDFDLKKNA